MKARIHKSKKSDEMRIDYYKVLKKDQYRYTLLKSILNDIKSDLTIYIDTNQKVRKQHYEGLLDYLKDNGLKYKEMPIHTRERKIFGVAIGKLLNTKKPMPTENVLVFEMTGALFNEDIFHNYLKSFDIAFGIERQCDFYDLCDRLLLDAGNVLFNTEYFKDFVYDSIICSSLRVTFDIEAYVKEISM